MSKDFVHITYVLYIAIMSVNVKSLQNTLDSKFHTGIFVYSIHHSDAPMYVPCSPRSMNC